MELLRIMLEFENLPIDRVNEDHGVLEIYWNEPTTGTHIDKANGAWKYFGETEITHLLSGI